MPIASRDEALKVLARILDIGERTQQLVEVTAAIGECTTEEARGVLVRAVQGFLQGGLETKRRKRKEILKEFIEADAKQAHDEGSVAARIRVIDREAAREELERKRKIDEEKTRALKEAEMLDEIGTSLDALKLSAVALDIFTDMNEFFEPWELARLVLRNEGTVRDYIVKGTQASDRAPLLGELTRIVLDIRPWWKTGVQKMRDLCKQISAEPNPWPSLGPARVTPDVLFDVIATTEMRCLYAIQRHMPNAKHMEGALRFVRQALEKILAVMYPEGLPSTAVPYR